MNEATNTGEAAARYRRLLAWYPKDHRERHGEEMLDVLLAGAGDRTRPTRRETVDLLRGAAKMHLRRVAGLDGGINHRDVFAIVSLLGPIVLLAGATPELDTIATWVRSGAGLSWDVVAYELMYVPLWLVWGVVALLSLFRLRRTAAAAAWLGTAGFVATAAISTIAFVPAVYYSFGDLLVVNAGWLVLGAVTAAALTWSPGPARGWELVGGARVGLAMGTVGLSVVLVMLSLGSYTVLFMPRNYLLLVQGPGRLALWFLALVVLVVGLTIAAGATSRAGRRAASVLCVPVVAGVLMLALPRDSDLVVVAAICYGAPMLALLGLGSLPRTVRTS